MELPHDPRTLLPQDTCSQASYAPTLASPRQPTSSATTCCRLDVLLLASVLPAETFRKGVCSQEMSCGLTRMAPPASISQSEAKASDGEMEARECHACQSRTHFSAAETFPEGVCCPNGGWGSHMCERWRAAAEVGRRGRCRGLGGFNPIL